MSNAQEIFDTVCEGLFKQGRASVNSDGLCQYRDEMGNKCAAGQILKEETYSPDFEGNTIASLYHKYGDRIFTLAPDDVHALAVLKELQLAHDDLWRANQDATFFMIQFPKEARRIAALGAFKLSTAKLDALPWPR